MEIDFSSIVVDSVETRRNQKRTSNSKEAAPGPQQAWPRQGFVENLQLAHQELSVVIDLINTVEANDAVAVAGMQRPKELPNEILSDLAVSAATKLQRLREASKLLSRERGHGNLKKLQKLLRLRQQHMVTEISTLYPVKSVNEQAFWETTGPHHNGKSSRFSTGSTSLIFPKPSHLSSLTILGLLLTILPTNKSYFSDRKEIQMSASALGCVAHAVSLISSYLDVPLRYPLHFGVSHSHIYDYAPPVENSSFDLLANPASSSMSSKPIEFPLFLDGQDTTRAAYAIFLLNKDLEQLLNYIGAESLGPRHVLPNLKELMQIILSEEYINV